MKRLPCLRCALLALSLVWLPVHAQEDKQLFFYNWVDFYPVPLLDKFEQETGIKVIMDGYESAETLLAKLQAGGSAYDVIVPTHSIMQTLIGQDLLLPINASEFSNFQYVKAAFRNPDYDPGRKYSAPYLWGSTGFSYDSARVPGGVLEDSWKAFFEPRPELSGQIAAMDTPSTLITAAAHYLGIDECSESNDDAKRILELLQKQRPHLKLYSSDNVVDRMASGEVILMQNWNGATARATAQKDSIRYVYPREGTPSFEENFAVPKDAPHPQNAKIFINWMMHPENAAAVTNAIAYSNAIEADHLLEDQWQAMEAINMPADYAPRLRPEKPCNNRARELQDRIWSRLKG